MGLQNSKLEQTALDLSERVQGGQQAQEQLASLRSEHDALQQKQDLAAADWAARYAQVAEQLIEAQEHAQQGQQAQQDELAQLREQNEALQRDTAATAQQLGSLQEQLRQLGQADQDAAQLREQNQALQHQVWAPACITRSTSEMNGSSACAAPVADWSPAQPGAATEDLCRVSVCCTGAGAA